ncbi:NADPH-dependent FMN reductase, partial [Streptomyces sp. 900105755]
TTPTTHLGLIAQPGPSWTAQRTVPPKETVSKNALDYLAGEWAGKPVAFVGYGGLAAGARAVQGLLPVVTALGMLPVAGSVHIPHVRRSFTTSGRFEAAAGLEQSAVGVLDGHLQITEATAAARTPITI